MRQPAVCHRHERGQPEVCVTPSNTCTPACSVASVLCRRVSKRSTSQADQPAWRPGLYVSLVLLPDGRLAAAYYDMNRRALVLAVRSGKGSSQFDGPSSTATRPAPIAACGRERRRWRRCHRSHLAGRARRSADVHDLERISRHAPARRRWSTPLSAPIRSTPRHRSISSTARRPSRRDGADRGRGDREEGHAVDRQRSSDRPRADGFSIAVTTGHGAPVLAWDSLDPANAPPNGLVVRSP